MKMLSEKDSLLFIVDIQEKLINAVFNKETVEKKSAIIAKAASILNIPIIATEQYPKGLGNTIDSIKSTLNENSKTFEKITFSALDNPEIKEAVTKAGKKQILICGIETHICVNQTARALKELGYDVTLIQDASGSRAETEHNAGIERMKASGINIATTEIALFEWLKGAKHPNFKEVQALIK